MIRVQGYARKNKHSGVISCPNALFETGPVWYVYFQVSRALYFQLSAMALLQHHMNNFIIVLLIIPATPDITWSAMTYVLVNRVANGQAAQLPRAKVRRTVFLKKRHYIVSNDLNIIIHKHEILFKRSPRCYTTLPLISYYVQFNSIPFNSLFLQIYLCT